MASLHRTIAHNMRFGAPKRVRKPISWREWHDQQRAKHPVRRNPIQAAQMAARKTRQKTKHAVAVKQHRVHPLAIRHDERHAPVPVIPPKHEPTPVQKPPSRGGLFGRVKDFVQRRRGV